MAEVILVEFQAKGLDGLTADLGQASTAVEGLNTDLNNTAKATTSVKAQMRQMNNELATMIANGDTSSQKFKDLTKKAGELSDAIQDASGYIKTAGSDTSGLDKALRATNVLVGGFAAVQGASALFGKESENLQKALLKVNAAMSILAGLQAIQEELSRKDSLFTQAAAKAKIAYAAATSGAVTATKLFGLALKGLGIGLVIAAVAYLYENFDKLTESIRKLNPKYREFMDMQEEQAKADNAKKDRIGGLKTAFDIEIAAVTEQIRVAEAYQNNQAQVYALEKKRIGLKLAYLDALEKESGRLTTLGQLERTKLQNDLKILNITYSQTKADKEEVKAIELLIDRIERLRFESEKLNEKEGQREGRVRAEGVETVISAEERLLQLREESANKFKEEIGGGGERATGTDPVVDLYKKRTEAAVAYFQLASDVNNQINGIIQKSQDAQLAQLQDRRAQGLITEKQYIQEVQKLKKKQAEQDKKISIFNIILNTAQAVSKALASAAPPFNFILAALVGALGAAELAIAKRTPLPAFRKGVIDLQGPGTGTSDSITARLSKGESVMTAEETGRHSEVLWAIRKRQFEKMFVPVADVIGKHRPLGIPASGTLSGNKNDLSSVKLDKIYEELVYQNIYTKEGNRTSGKIREAVTNLKYRHGIRV